MPSTRVFVVAMGFCGGAPAPPYAVSVPQATLDPPAPSDLRPPSAHPGRRPQYIAGAAALLLGAALGDLATHRLVPGGSLLRPTLFVLVPGALVVLAAWVVASFASRTRWLWTFAVTMVLSTALAAVWTFFAALPLSVLLDRTATGAAEQALARAASEQDARGDVVPAPCAVDRAGRIGPLKAPYRACTLWSPLAHVVTFDAWGPGRSGGLAYIASARPGVNTLPDRCVRHLVGSWWMFGNPTDAGGDPGQCPIGYHFDGGG